MALYNTTNIKELPELEEIVNGNYIIVENEEGTHILDFRNFVVGPENVLSNYPRHFEVYLEGTNAIKVANGTKSGNTVFNSELSNIKVHDINIIPTNIPASSMSWCALLSYVQNPGFPTDPSPYTYTLTISSNTNSVGSAVFNAKVLKYF